MLIGKILDAANGEAVATFGVVAWIDASIVIEVQVIRVVRVGSVTRRRPIVGVVADVAKGAAIVVAEAGNRPPGT